MIRSAFVKCTDRGADKLLRVGRARLLSTIATASSSSSSLSGGIVSYDFRPEWNQNQHLGGAARGMNRNTTINRCTGIHTTRRWYTPITKEEEAIEKARVSHLSPDEKEDELRQFNREIMKLETLRGINTGELYTWSGRYKALVKNYGFPLFVYYWALWATMGGVVYLGIDLGGLDAMAILERIDANTGWAVSEKVDPQFGKIGVAMILNECLEPVRLPFVVVTLKPVMDIVSPPKY